MLEEGESVTSYGAYDLVNNPTGPLLHDLKSNFYETHRITHYKKVLGRAVGKRKGRDKQQSEWDEKGNMEQT